MRKWLAPVGIGVGVITLGVLALVREPARFDADSPEGAVQEYLQAIADEDFDAAFELLHAEAFGGCDSRDIRRAARDTDFSATLANGGDGFFGGMHLDEFDRAFVEPEAEVDVILRFGGGSGPFDTGWEEWTSFGLVEDDDGFWWIVGDPWPYFRWACNPPEGDF